VFEVLRKKQKTMFETI